MAIGKRQEYVPFGFTANGQSTAFSDLGEAKSRLVAAFLSREDLDRLLVFAEIESRLNPLRSTPLLLIDLNSTKRSIALPMCLRVKSVGALLVMATGTAKTWTTMAIIDLFQRANQAQNVLFLADGDALVVCRLAEIATS